MQFALENAHAARRERAEAIEAAAARTLEREALRSPLARLLAGETVDPLNVSDAEFEAIFPAAVFAAVLVDMVRVVERHQKGEVAQKTT